MILNMKLLAPLAAVVVIVAACQSVPDSELASNTAGESVLDSDVSSAGSESTVDTNSIDSGTI